MSKETLTASSYQVRQATFADAPQISNLLSLRSVPPGSVKFRDINELNQVISNEDNYVCVVCSNTGEILAVASLEVYERPNMIKSLPGLAEVRSVAASVDGKGLGKRAVLDVLKRARQ